MQSGCVYLVGAGPGDPELLTVKGLRLIQEADVILFDGLANQALLNHARAGCICVNVEKRPGFQRVQQEDINKLMVDHARTGESVVRLKGGDPIVFGRGGEEAEVLKKEGIPFEIVPGISSAIAAPAYAGIPVTYRGVSTHFTVVTGTTTALEGQHEVNWELLGQAGGTLLILMGTRNRAEISRRLIKGGRSVETPTTVIYKGTTPAQKTIRTQLGKLADIPIQNPSVIVVGAVAGIDFQWFETRPLMGRTLAVTRARTQASDLVKRLEQLGAYVIEVPTIEIAAVEAWDLVDLAIADLPHTDWVVFTSVNGVSYFFNRIFALGLDLRVLADVKIAAIGQATGDHIRGHHLNVDLEPQERDSEGFLGALINTGSLTGVHFLIPGPEKARSVLPDGLKNSGARVREVAVYKTMQPNALPERFVGALKEQTLDLVTFTSSSTVTNLSALLSGQDVPTPIKAACIGPVTAQTALDNGYHVAVQLDSEDISIDGLVKEVVNYFAIEDVP